MKISLHILIVTVVLFIGCSNIGRMNKTYPDNKKINLKYNYYIKGNDSLLFDIFYSIPYKQMIFKKNKDNFISTLNTNINIINNEKQIFSNSWNQDIVSYYYEDTKSSEKTFTYSLVLPNTENKLSLTINDYENHKYWHLDTLLTAKEYKHISNISIYNKYDGKFSILKNRYIEDAIDTVWLKFQLVDSEFNENVEIELSEFENRYNKISLDEKMIKINEINYFPLVIDEFMKQVKISVKYKEEYREVFLKFFNEQDAINMGELIGPVEYLLTRKEYIDYMELDSLKKINFIESFWNQKYNNQLLDEFYDRVRYVNVNYFESIDKGWRSDRGRIYILNGPPLSINHEFNENGEFEIWSYSSRKFIFINKYGIFECYMCN